MKITVMHDGKTLSKLEGACIPNEGEIIVISPPRIRYIVRRRVFYIMHREDLATTEVALHVEPYSEEDEYRQNTFKRRK